MNLFCQSDLLMICTLAFLIWLRERTWQMRHVLGCSRIAFPECESQETSHCIELISFSHVHNNLWLCHVSYFLDLNLSFVQSRGMVDVEWPSEDSTWKAVLLNSSLVSTTSHIYPEEMNSKWHSDGHDVSVVSIQAFACHLSFCSTDKLKVLLCVFFPLWSEAN